MWSLWLYFCMFSYECIIRPRKMSACQSLGLSPLQQPIRFLKILLTLKIFQNGRQNPDCSRSRSLFYTNAEVTAIMLRYFVITKGSWIIIYYKLLKQLKQLKAIKERIFLKKVASRSNLLHQDWAVFYKKRNPVNELKRQFKRDYYQSTL